MDSILPVSMLCNTPHDRALESYTNAFIELIALGNPSRSEVEAIELLTLLAERYEETHFPIPAGDAVSVVRFLLEHQDLTQRDLIPESGRFLRGRCLQLWTHRES